MKSTEFIVFMEKEHGRMAVSVDVAKTFGGATGHRRRFDDITTASKSRLRQLLARYVNFPVIYDDDGIEICIFNVPK